MSDSAKVITRLRSTFGDVAAEFRMNDVDWRPLERAIPADRLGGFMFMGHQPNDPRGLRLYKHGITRRYLVLDGDAQPYRNVAGRYVLTTIEQALAHVYEDLEHFGATPDTAYDAAYRRDRDRALNAAGYLTPPLNPDDLPTA